MKHICEIHETTFDELPPDEQQLITQARLGAEKAFAPYSEFFVGAAALLNNGEYFYANNQENSSFPVGICAERSLLSYLGSIQKIHLVEKIAIVAFSTKIKVPEPVFPCGMCRQTMAEYEYNHNKEWTLLLKGESDKVYKLKGVAKNLLPFTFRLEL